MARPKTWGPIVPNDPPREHWYDRLVNAPEPDPNVDPDEAFALKGERRRVVIRRRHKDEQ